MQGWFFWVIVWLGMLWGFALVIWAHLHAKANNINREEKKQLITTGPYSIVRHPEYAGEIFICISCSGFVPTMETETGNFLMTLALFGLWGLIFTIIRKSLGEEVELKRIFGKQAQEYFETVKKRWIPFFV